MADDEFPFDLDYNKDLPIGLTTQTIDYFGLRVAQIYNQSLDLDTLDFLENPIPLVFEWYKYNWDQNTNLPISRIKEIYFYQEDGSLTEQKKLLPKEFYNTSDRADIVTKRRQTIVSWLISRATELNLQTELNNYFLTYKAETDKYLLYGNNEIINLINNSTLLWMDKPTNTVMGTIKEALVLCLTKALESTSNEEITIYLESLSLLN